MYLRASDIASLTRGLGWVAGNINVNIHYKSSIIGDLLTVRNAMATSYGWPALGICS